MILADFIAYNQYGLYCRYGDFYIDPQTPVKHAVISHAHGDHAVNGNNHVYCTEPTMAFMKLRYGKNAASSFNICPYHQEFQLGGVDIMLIPAGHILGSGQILMTFNGMRYLYTGDYKLQPDATCEPIECIEADVLITESTFAKPGTKHPDAIIEVQKLNHIKSNILLGAYALGKSQRLIHLINAWCPQKKLLIHHKVFPLCAVYEQFGFSLGSYQLYGRKLMKEQKEFVYIVPPFTFDSYFKAKDVKRLFASGWKNLQTNEQDTLFISDHVDWEDILSYVKLIKPKEIWTLHGDGSYLQQYFEGQITVKIIKPC